MTRVLTVKCECVVGDLLHFLVLKSNISLNDSYFFIFFLLFVSLDHSLRGECGLHCVLHHRAERTDGGESDLRG